MSKGNTFENDFLKLIFNAVAIAGLAENPSVGALTVLYVALHTADPGEGGDQTTSEAIYDGYARVAINRDGSGFTVSGNSVSPAGTISFPVGTAGADVQTITHFSIGVAVSGASKILYSGTVTPNITTGEGIVPQFTTASAITED